MSYTPPAIDPAAPDALLSATLDLSAVLTSGLARLDNTLARRLAPVTAQPVFYRFPRSGIVGADGTVTLRLHGPDQGHIWYVRSVTAGGVSPSTATPGLADVFILAGNPGQSVEPSLMDWRDQASRLPAIAFYGDGEMEVHANESVFVRFSGCTVGQNVAAVVQVQDIQEGADVQSWSL